MDAQELAILACQKSKEFLKPGISEKAFAAKCEEIMYSLGAEALWYPMLVNFHKNTIYCTRGNHLPAEDAILRETDIVLVDFSPMKNGLWGDYSETLAVGHDPLFHCLITDARHIFELTYAYAKHSETIGELFRFCEQLIQAKGYKLLDPNGNIGHSIEDYDNQDKRIYISPDHESIRLKGKRWAIEPHIGIGNYGAKFENVIEL
ncbi:M24 family metallopeptidase [Gorillibacterium timonense]|uniref:M24 family metallopeptidase n=1 Tax=Gorillibacterium timonense TaxID=1689269 RepID=UPI00071C6E82|nr:M24 family metallopeptidase [Gorillibacterium timonense]